MEEVQISDRKPLRKARGVTHGLVDAVHAVRDADVAVELLDAAFRLREVGRRRVAPPVGERCVHKVATCATNSRGRNISDRWTDSPQIMSHKSGENGQWISEDKRLMKSHVTEGRFAP